MNTIDSTMQPTNLEQKATKEQERALAAKRRGRHRTLFPLAPLALLCGAMLVANSAAAATLCEALDECSLMWVNIGNSAWFGQTTTTHDGVDAAQSGSITHSQHSLMLTTLAGPGSITFWWSVSSESGHDYLEFYTNGTLARRISGTVGWTSVSNHLAGGNQTLSWRYMKDGSGSSGQDKGWVDQVSFVPDVIDSLQVQPFDSWVAAGLQGGPFNPDSRVYVLSNSSASVLSWSVSASQSWITANPSAGVLAAGDRTNVTMLLDASAASLPIGMYPAVMTFSNLTSGVAQTRGAQLAINGVRYVNLNNPTPAAPYTDWATAATNIQDAVDVAVAGDEIVVTNGIYETGARSVYGMSNRVAVIKPLTVRSVNGPEVTLIRGYQIIGAAAIRCVYLTHGAVLAGFTLTNGATQSSGDTSKQQSGGGVWCESTSAVVTNCVVTRNRAAYSGGGAYSGTLTNCLLTDNSAFNQSSYGGGASQSTLNHCTLANNTADSGFGVALGGGAYNCTLSDCVLTNNSADNGGGLRLHPV